MTIKNYLFLFFSISIYSQTIPVGSINLAEERLRNEQLIGANSSDYSMCLRPILKFETALNSENKTKKGFHFSSLPVDLIQQYNSLAPMGRNDGLMIPAKGYQIMASAGFVSSYGPLSLQFKPEFVWADNLSFQTFPTSEKSNVRLNYINYLNHSDIPERFGNQSYHKLFWGQTALNLSLNRFVLSLSTENLWWGPGKYNALIMSNNAPGFWHIDLKTKKPIKTFLGSFEAQLISGKLLSSGFGSSDTDFIVDGVDYRVQKSSDWRYLSGLTINYQPKWIPGLYVGLNRVFQLYHSDLGKGFSDYFPVITPFQKKNLNDEDGKNRDQVASVFLRWILKESKSEIYIENGWNDHSQNLVDLYLSPSHSRALLVGFGKIFPLNNSVDNYVKFNFEHCQLQQSADRIVRPAGAWYMHGQVFHGYTQMSQVMGAGIGPGANSQTLDISFWRQKKVIGFQLERYAHNLDFYYDAYPGYNQKWVDLSLKSYAYKSFGNLGILAKFNTSLMYNYQWQEYKDKLNFQLQIAVQYKL